MAKGVVVTVSGNVAPLQASLNSAAASVKAFESGITRAAAGFTRAGAAMTRVGGTLSKGVTLPLVAIGAASFKMANEFDKSMSKMEALVKANRGHMEILEKGIMDVSEQTGESATDMADAMYFITSSGIPAAKATDVLRVSAKAAAAGLGETKTIADAVTSAINAYGAENLSASEAVDTMVAAIDQGKAEPEEFADSLGRVMAVAQQSGVSFQEVTAAMAAMSLQGLKASEGATAVRSILSGFMKGGTKAGIKALESVGMSYKMIRQEVAEKGLLPTLVKIREAIGKDPEKLAAVFGNIRAFTGTAILTGKTLKQNTAIFKELGNATGTTAEAFKKASEKSSFQWNKALNTMKLSLIQFGAVLAPIFVQIAKWMAQAAKTIGDAFQRLSPETQKLVIVIAAVAAAAGPVLMIMGSLAGAIGAILPVVAAVLTPIGLFVTALVAIAGAMALAQASPDAAASLFQKMGMSAQTAATLVDTLRTAFSVLSTVVGAAFSALNSDMGRWIITSALMVAAGMKIVAVATAIVQAIQMIRVAISLLAVGGGLMGPITGAVIALGIVVGGLYTAFSQSQRGAEGLEQAFDRATSAAGRLKGALDAMKDSELGVREAKNQYTQAVLRAQAADKANQKVFADANSTAQQRKQSLTDLEAALLGVERADLNVEAAVKRNEGAHRKRNTTLREGMKDMRNLTGDVVKFNGTMAQDTAVKKYTSGMKELALKWGAAALAAKKGGDEVGAKAAAKVSLTATAAAKLAEKIKKVPSMSRIKVEAKAVNFPQFYSKLLEAQRNMKKAEGVARAAGKNAGSGFGATLVTGIEGYIGQAYAAGAALASAARAGAGKAAGESSPPKRWKELGYESAKAYADAMKKKEGLLAQMGAGLSVAALRGAMAGIEPLSGKLEERLEAIKGRITGSLQNLGNTLGTIATTTGMKMSGLAAGIRAQIDKAGGMIDQAQMAAKLDRKLTALAAVVDAQKAKLMGAFGRIAQSAMDAFDANTQAGLDRIQKRLDTRLKAIAKTSQGILDDIETARGAPTESEAALSKLDRDEAERQRQQALVDAQAGGDPEAIRAAELAITRARLEAKAEVERQEADKLAAEAAQREQDRLDKVTEWQNKHAAKEQLDYNSKRARQKTNLQLFLDDLTTQLEKQPGKWKKIHDQVMAKFRGEFGPDFKTAGRNLGIEFAAGLNSEMGRMGSAAENLARMIAKFLKGSSPPEAGPLSDIDLWGNKLILGELIGGIDVGKVADSMEPVGKAFANGFWKGVDTGMFEGEKKMAAAGWEWDASTGTFKKKQPPAPSSGAGGGKGGESGDLPGGKEEKKDDPMAGVAAKFNPDLMGIATNAAAALNKSEAFGEALQSGNIKTDARLLDLLSQAGIRIWGPAASGYPFFTNILNEMRPEPKGLGLSGRDAAMKYGLTYPPVVMAARGGFVDHPTRLIAGERGPEAIIPLSSSRGRKMMQASGGAGGGVTITFKGPVYGGTPEQLARVLTPAIAQELRRDQARGGAQITRVR